MRGERRAYVVLAALMVVLAAASILFTVHYVRTTEREFCQVVTGVTSQPVPKPADAAANPSREQNYEWYERFVRLGRDLGC
jgi:hypothetical protein